MSVELNHTIVHARDKAASAGFLARIIGLPAGPQAGPFLPVALANRVTLDYMDSADVRPQHYAFLVGDEEFDAAFARLRAAGIRYFADPGHERPGEINCWRPGRGVYFSDPDGHNMELLIRE